jgi:hypothetical protein
MVNPDLNVNEQKGHSQCCFDFIFEHCPAIDRAARHACAGQKQHPTSIKKGERFWSWNWNGSPLWQAV